MSNTQNTENGQSPRHPAVEPTRDEHRRLALNHLRDQAREAHASGDGILAHHLSSVAVSNVRRWLDKGSCGVPFRELRWMFIFCAYWFGEEHVDHEIDPALMKASNACKSDLDVATLDCIKNLRGMVTQSLGSCEEQIGFLKKADLSWLGHPWVQEDAAFLTLCIEFAFYRGPVSRAWLDLADD